MNCYNIDITILNYVTGTVETIMGYPENKSDEIEDYLTERGYRLSDCYWMTTVNGEPYRKIYQYNGQNSEPSQI